MSAFFQVFSYLFLILICFFVGFPCVLIKGKRDENWLDESIVLGCALLVLISFWLSVLGFPFSSSSFPTMILCLVGSSVVCWNKRNAFKQYITNVRLKSTIPYLLAFFAGALVLIMPVFWNAIYPYCDGYTYICISDYLLDYSYFEKVDAVASKFHPWLSQMDVYQTYHFRIGSQMLLSFFTGCFKLEKSIELFMPCTGLGVFIGCLSAKRFVNKIHIYKKDLIGTLSVILYGFNATIILWNAVYGFYPQTIGCAFCLMLFSCFVDFEKWKDNRIWNICLTGITAANLALVYNEMLVFAALAILCLLLYSLLKNREKIKRHIIDIVATISLAIILIIPYFGGMIKAILSQLGAVVGWEQNKNIWTYLAYLYSIVAPEDRVDVSLNYKFIVTFFISLVLVIGFISIVRNSFETAIKYILLSIPYIIFLMYFGLVVDNPFGEGRGNSWSFFKLIQYYSIIVIPIIAVIIGHVIDKVWKQNLLLICIGAYMLFNIIGIARYSNILAENMRIYTGNRSNPLGEYYLLEQKYNLEDNKIRLINVPQKHRQMITYFLKKCDLVSDWETDGYFGTIPILTENDEKNIDLNLNYVETDGEICNLARDALLFNLGEGFYGIESQDGMKWSWSTKEGYLSVAQNAAEEKDVNLCMGVSAANGSEGILRIYDADGKLILEDYLQNDIKEITIPIKTNRENEIHFSYDGPEKEAGGSDERKLAFCISNWKVIN